MEYHREQRWGLVRAPVTWQGGRGLGSEVCTSLEDTKLQAEKMEATFVGKELK